MANLKDLYNKAKKFLNEEYAQPVRNFRNAPIQEKTKKLFMATTPFGALDQAFTNKRSPVSKFFKREQVSGGPQQVLHKTRIRDVVREAPGATYDVLKTIPQDLTRLGISALEAPRTLKRALKGQEIEERYYPTPFGKLGSLQTEAQVRAKRGESVLKSIAMPTLDLGLGVADLGALKPVLKSLKGLKGLDNLTPEIRKLLGDLDVPLGANRTRTIPARTEPISPNLVDQDPSGGRFVFQDGTLRKVGGGNLTRESLQPSRVPEIEYEEPFKFDSKILNIRPGMNIEDISKQAIPEAINTGKKRRQLIQSLKDSPAIAPRVKTAIESRYNPIPNLQTLGDAGKRIAKDFESSVTNAKTNSQFSTDIQSDSILLMNELQLMGRWDDAVEVAVKTAERATEGGQGTQILAVYNKLQPEGILRFAQSEVEKAKRLNPEKYKFLQITGEQAGDLRGMAEAIQKIDNVEDKMMATREMLDEIGRLVPTPWAKKATTLWKAGLLTGVKGAVGGNIVGNTSMAMLKKLSDIPATAIDSAIGTITGQRGKVFTTRGILDGLWEGTKIGASNLRKGIGAEDVVNKLDYQKTYFSKSKLGKAAQFYTDSVFNFYSASDRPFFHSALQNALNELSMVAGKNKGLKGKELKKFVDDMVKSPTDDILTSAHDEASTMVFQNKNALGSLLSKGKQALRDTGQNRYQLLSEGVVPFTGVPSAIASAVHNYSVTGAIDGAIRAFKAIRKKDFGVKEQKALSEALGKGLTGTGVMALGFHLVNKKLMTGEYPSDQGERTLWEQEGKLPYSVKVGGKWRSLNYTGPIMSLMAIGGQVAESEGDSAVEKITAGVGGSGKAILGSSPLQGAQSFMNVLTDPQRYGDSYVKNIAGSVVPTLIKDVAKTGDPLARKSDNIRQSIQSRIPGARNKLISRKDFFGEESERRTGPIATMIDPFRSSKVKGDKSVEELRRLQDEGFGPTLSKLTEDIKAFGESQKLTPEEFDAFQVKTGQEMKASLDGIVSSSAYQTLGDEDKKDVIDKAINAIKRENKEAIISGETGDAPKNLSEINVQAKREIQKRQLENSDKSSMKVDGGYLVKSELGTASFKSDAKYNSELATAKLSSYKRSGNVESWFKKAEEKFGLLQAQYEDPNTDELDKIKIANQAETLMEQYTKYKGYGGFTKPKKGKKAKKLNVGKLFSSAKAPSTPDLTTAKINLSGLKAPRKTSVRAKRINTKIKLKGGRSSIPGSRRLV